MLGFAPLGGAPLGAPDPQGQGVDAAPGHRYWRLNYDSTMRGSAGCASLEFHTSRGGSDVSGQGTPIASSSYAGDHGAGAFDNNSTTNWSSDYGQTNGWVGIDFGTHRPSVVEIAYLPRGDGTFGDTDSPKPGGVEYSDDGATWTRLFTVNQPTYAAGTDYIFNTQTAGNTAIDGLTIGDALNVDIYNLNGILVEGLNVSAALAVRWTAHADLVQMLMVSDLTYQGQQYNPQPISVSDGIKLHASDDGVRGRLVTLAETLQTADIMTSFYGMVVREVIPIRSTLVANGTYNGFVREAVRLAEMVRQGFAVTASDTMQLVSLLDARSAILLVEAMRIAGTLQSGTRYTVQLTQSMKLADSLARFFGADLTDAVGVAELLTGLRIATGALAETVEITDVFDHQFLLSISFADGIELSAEQALQMLYQPTLAEGIDITGGWLEPDGSFTTWVMNTRTAAMSEYANFSFNSLAQVGNICLGASEDGLYELRGDDDDGDDIIASIRGGYMQFGGTQLSRLKEAYIAARGEGQFVLKVRTADGDTYIYTVDSRNMRNSKIHMGKGMRARYFGYELVSTGQDFDLDTLEFVPIVVQRRV